MGNKPTSVLVVAPPGRIRDALCVLIRASIPFNDAKQVVYIRAVDDGAMGLQALAACPPDLVVLDASLPDGQAWEILQQRQASYPHIPCMVVVQYHHQKRRAWDAGADGVLLASFAAETLFEALGELLPG
jgi:DNA-binding NarL/FixJ family response regulator